MNNIKDLTDQEKSALLIKAMKWTLVFPPDWNDFDVPFADIISNNGEEIDVLWDVYPAKQWDKFTLYNSSNTGLAWRVLNWAVQEIVSHNDEYSWHHPAGAWFAAIAAADLSHMPPANAQRLWLDKILELAIEGGLVEIETIRR